MPIILEWMKCFGDNWCGLFDLKLDNNYFVGLEGVYIIWYWQDGCIPVTVRVGQGSIRDRLLQHREEPQMLALRDRHLLVTWASVPDFQHNGVERYLGENLYPIMRSRLPNTKPTRVNLPWEESSVIPKKI